MKIVLPFLIFIFLIGKNEIFSDTNFFKAFAHECNNTFPVTHEIILAPNISKLTENLKNDRNAKCFVHCIFHKLNFLDNKGNVNKSELFENASNVWAKIPEDKKGSIAIPKITPQLKEIVSSFIDFCETKEISSTVMRIFTKKCGLAELMYFDRTQRCQPTFLHENSHHCARYFCSPYTVAQETDPCNKFYNFAQCLIDDFASPEATSK